MFEILHIILNRLFVILFINYKYKFFKCYKILGIFFIVILHFVFKRIWEKNYICETFHENKSNV